MDEIGEWVPSREDVVHVVEALGDAWKNRDAEAMGELFAEDATYAVRPFAADLLVFRGRLMIKEHWAEQLSGNQRVRRFRHHEHALLIDRDTPRCLAKWEVELEGLYRPMRVLQIAMLSLERPQPGKSTPLITELETYRHSESNNKASRRGVSPATPHAHSTEDVKEKQGDASPRQNNNDLNSQELVDGACAPSTDNDRSRGPDLPRQRITEVQVEGHVDSWKGKYGWILPNQEFDHPSANMHKGRVYVHSKDLGGVKKLRAKTPCKFHVYCDADGLGAEEVTPLESGDSVVATPHQEEK